MTLKEPISVPFILRELVSLALPVTLSTLMIPLVGLVEIILVPDRLLAAGFTVAASTTALGYLTGMAMPLVNMGTIPTNSLAWSTVPAIRKRMPWATVTLYGTRPVRHCASSFFLPFPRPWVCTC